MRLYTEGKLTETEDIEIKYGIFQGDSFSPKLFCISLFALTEKLNKLNTGYEEHTIKIKVSHLLYMDALKMIGKPVAQLQKQMQIVRNFRDDAHTEFGLDKCGKIVLKKGKSVNSQNLILDINREIQQIERGKINKYLGIEASEGIQHQKMK
jgi:hypothetical protein